MYLKTTFLCICFEFVSPQAFSQAVDFRKAARDNVQPSDFIIGADISELKKVEDFGGVFKVNRVEKAALTILKDHWFEYLRLNIFHTPDTWNTYMQLETNLLMAPRIRNAGFKLLLDLHYSDTWANPGVQTKPKAWQNLAFEVLKDSVYQYTKNIVTLFKRHGAGPDMVQIGNEITGGMLWDDGHVGGAYETPAQWQKFAALLKAGIQGAHAALDPGASIQIMIHPAAGESKTTCQWFFDNLFSQGVDFDIIGLSFYSYWGGRINDLAENVNLLASRYHKDIIVVETSYPWTLEDYDQVPNWMPDPHRLHPGYPATITGQQSFLEDVIAILKSVPHGKGIFVWQPIDISPPRCGSGAENITLFDFHGVLLPSMKAFAPAGVAQIRLRLNCASIPDTLGAHSFFEVRGSLNNNYPIVLSDGNLLDWSDGSQIELVHQAGDYFTGIFYAPVGSWLRFKFWSRDALALDLNGGWETGNSNTDPDGNAVISIHADTTLPLHFFNCAATQKPCDGRPWEPKDHFTAVWFRVYLNTLEGLHDGYISENVNLKIGIRGANLSGAGPLDWNTTKVRLQRESNDKKLAGYHLFSGVAYYPPSLRGQTQAYKFFIEPNGWEEGNLTGDRAFVIPEQDTTLHWVYYGNTTPISKGPHKITLQLNCASIPDTIGPNALIQVRGEINGIAPFALPDGNLIDWSDKSTLTLSNLAGDYFQISFMVPDSAELRFKFWSQEAERLGLNAGWEMGDLNGDRHGNTVIKAMTNASLPRHFFNASGEKKPYHWRPYQTKADSLAVWFRVYMHTTEGIKDGYNPALPNQLISVRGGNLLGWINVLDWDRTKVILQRESGDKNSPAFHLFSGVAYYPRLKVLRPEQDYKFFIEPNGWEEGNLTDNRKVVVPAQDTTIHWVYYGDTSPRLTDIHVSSNQSKSPDQFLISYCYPNPFNFQAVIHYELPGAVVVKMEIYNLLGQRIKTLMHQKQAAGAYNITWDGSTEETSAIAAGIYLCRLQADNFVKIIKLLVIK